MEYSLEIKKYKSGKMLPIMRFDAGYELLTEFLFVNATSVNVGDMLVEELEELVDNKMDRLNSTYNEINLEADYHKAILSKETGEQLVLDTKDLIQITKAYIIEVLKYKKM